MYLLLKLAWLKSPAGRVTDKILKHLSYLSPRRKTLPRCSYWADKVTEYYSEVMFASARPPASLQSCITDNQTHTCTDSTDTSLQLAGTVG